MRALALFGLFVTSVPVAFYGCGGESGSDPAEEPQVENYCGWLSDPDNCYRQFARDNSPEGVYECSRLGEQTADDARGFFTTDSLQLCALVEGGQIIVEGLADFINPPPPNPGDSAPLPPLVGFTLVRQNMVPCGRLEFLAPDDFTLTVNPRDGLEGGTFIMAGGSFAAEGEQRSTALTTCPAIVPEGGGDPVPEVHYFDTLLTLKCPQYAALQPRVELDIIRGGLDANGDPDETQKYGAVKARILFPPKEGSLVDAKPEAVNLFTCVTPPPPEPCENMVKDGLETGTDCGGPICERRCGAGEGCQTEADCAGFPCDYVLGLKQCIDPTMM